MSCFNKDLLDVRLDVEMKSKSNKLSYSLGTFKFTTESNMKTYKNATATSFVIFNTTRNVLIFHVRLYSSGVFEAVPASQLHLLRQQDFSPGFHTFELFRTYRNLEADENFNEYFCKTVGYSIVWEYAQLITTYHQNNNYYGNKEKMYFVRVKDEWKVPEYLQQPPPGVMEIRATDVVQIVSRGFNVSTNFLIGIQWFINLYFHQNLGL